MEYQDSTYGERIAAIYDEQYAAYDPAMIDVLHELAGDGPVLELGIGTGRVALPLAERGVRVAGIDASDAMVARLRAKEGGADINVHMGSFADFDLGEKFKLVFVVFNTFYALLTQELQIASFQSIRRHLAPGGTFLLEAFYPDVGRFIDGQTSRVIDIGEGMVQMDVSRHDALTQQITSQHIFLSEAGTRLYPVKLRYAWPSELDLMAKLAGLKLKHRWGSWAQDAFSPRSSKHISVYGE